MFDDETIIVLKKDVVGYFTEDFYSAISIWSITQRYGLPNNDGWQNEPFAVIEILNLFDNEKSKIEREALNGFNSGNARSTNRHSS